MSEFHNHGYRVSDQTRNEVWDKYYKTLFAERYYQSLGNDYLRRHQILTYLTIALGGGALVPPLLVLFLGSDSNLSSVWLALNGVALAAVSVTNLTGNFARKASATTYISRSCATASRELADLLSRIDRNVVDEDDARAELKQLALFVDTETYISEAVGINVSETDERSERAANRTISELKSLYATD